MQILCPCCKTEYVYLSGDNIGKNTNYYGNCVCGARIDFDKDKNGNIVRESTRCPKTD
jgi:hypothetical protein